MCSGFTVVGVRLRDKRLEEGEFFEEHGGVPQL
jgi:hypothetical protein